MSLGTILLIVLMLICVVPTWPHSRSWGYRTPMGAVYTLLCVERGIPEVFNSTYDIRTLLGATGRLRDGKEIDIPGPAFVRNLLMNKLDRTQIGALLREFGLVTGD